MTSAAETIAKDGNAAFAILKTLSNEQRSAALKAIHDGLQSQKLRILDANKIDMQNARDHNLSASLVKRLDLSNADKFDAMLLGILDVAALDDPVGQVTLARKLA